MASSRWIRQRVPSLGALTPSQVKDFRDFPILWALFEGRSLNYEGDAEAIIGRVRQWNASLVLHARHFEEPLAHFRARYFAHGEFTDHYHQLTPPPRNPHPTMRRVLNGEADGAVQRVQGVLLVVQRYRHNFLHGAKIDGGLADQSTNFRMANRALVAAIKTEEAFQAVP